MQQNYEYEIIDLLILGDYSFSDLAEMFEIPISEVKRIYRNYMASL